MNDLTVNVQQLPDTVEDLAKFALVGREKLKAVRAEINAIEKVGLAKEVLEQKRAEAQEIAELVTLSEVKIGAMLKQIPKATNNNPTGKNQYGGQIRTAANLTNTKTKDEVLTEIGIKKDTAARLQKMAEHEDIVHAAIEEARANDDIVNRTTVLNKIKEVEKQKRREEKKERKLYTLTDIMPEDVCKLFVSDIRDGLPDISDNSVDYIITDPPYSKEFIPLYGELSKLAARVLKPGGSLIAMAGQSYLPEVITELSKYMAYHWCLSYLTPGGQSPQLFHKRVNTFWKPVLWFIKDKYNGDYIGDVLKSSTNDNDKRFHEWGQSISGMKDIVERFTNPGDLILDPFLGGGTTGVVAVSTGRKFIGIDIDKENINIADSRIKEAYVDVTSERRKNRLER